MTFISNKITLNDRGTITLTITYINKNTSSRNYKKLFQNLKEIFLILVETNMNWNPKKI